ncbi:hypothetical protein AOLI_G00202640 [Acnodon oligacanthus]
MTAERAGRKRKSPSSPDGRKAREWWRKEEDKAAGDKCERHQFKERVPSYTTRALPPVTQRVNFKEFYTAGKEAIKTLVHLHLAG